MSATSPTADALELDSDDREQWSVGRARGGVSDDGQRYRIEWHPRDAVKRALFRVSTDDRVCILQHVRTVLLRQRGESRCELDDSATLDDVPEKFLRKMERDGYQPVVGVEAYA